MKSLKTFALALGLIGAGGAGIHNSANAQDIHAACVEMKWRSAVCVKMRIVYKGQKGDWSKSICAHSRQCRSVHYVPAGEKYHIELKSDGGNKWTTCGKNHRKSQPGTGRRAFFRAGGNILPKWMGGGIWCDNHLRRVDWGH